MSGLALVCPVLNSQWESTPVTEASDLGIFKSTAAL